MASVQQSERTTTIKPNFARVFKSYVKKLVCESIKTHKKGGFQCNCN